MSIDFSVLFFSYFIIFTFLLKFVFFFTAGDVGARPWLKEHQELFATGGIRKCKGSGRIPWLMESMHRLFPIDCASWPEMPLSNSYGLGCP